MKQTTLLQFWNQNKQPSSTIDIASSMKSILAHEALPFYYVRPIPDDPQYLARLKEEYELIDKNSFVRVFLQVQTILTLIQKCSQTSGKPILHIIRGSAGSSLVCYLLGITQIDPIRYGIELARFMNHCRTDIPDIDIDVPYNRRDEIYAAIANTWKDQVARVSNHVLWKKKTATRHAVKQVLQEKQQTTEIQSALRAVGRKQFQVAKLLPDKKDQEAVKIISSKLEGTLKNYSKHCGGIVVFEEEGKVPDSLVLRSLSVQKETMYQLTLNKDEVEEQGFCKIDVLCNRGLAQLTEICPTRPLTMYPTRDSATERIFSKGLTFGVTFGESRGMRKLFIEMQPRNIEEVAIALALIRPAAAAEGRKSAFLEKWSAMNRQSDEESSGIYRPIIFDDDAILKIRRLLNCDSAEADRWRKAFAKGNAEARVQFRQLLIEKGYSKYIQDAVIDDLEQLIYYSFCKSHAISYAQLVWALAYWKAHHPHAFWCAALNHCHSDFRKWVHYREALLSGVGLCRSSPPYILGTRQGQPVLVPINTQEQTLLIETENDKQAIHDMKIRGYWLTKDFLPSCGIWFDTQTRLDGKRPVRFCGLIVSGRVVQRNGMKCTLLCIGTANGVYYDIVIGNTIRSDLFRYGAVEGSGILREGSSIYIQTIDVQTIRGRSITSLLQ